MHLVVILLICAWLLAPSCAQEGQQVGVRQSLFCLLLLPVELAPALIIAYYLFQLCLGFWRIQCLGMSMVVTICPCQCGLIFAQWWHVLLPLALPLLSPCCVYAGTQRSAWHFTRFVGPSSGSYRFCGHFGSRRAAAYPSSVSSFGGGWYGDPGGFWQL